MNNCYKGAAPIPVSFPPLIDNDSRALILGSMPGEQSLHKQEYYGNPRNHFWSIIYDLLKRRNHLPLNGAYLEDYAEKKAFLLGNQLALWDVLRECERIGSLDANIKRPETNDFGALLARYPRIEHIFFNGAEAERLFMKLVFPTLSLGARTLTFRKLPSSSPARALPLRDKIAQWSEVAQCLE